MDSYLLGKDDQRQVGIRSDREEAPQSTVIFGSKMVFLLKRLSRPEKVRTQDSCYGSR